MGEVARGLPLRPFVGMRQGEQPPQRAVVGAGATAGARLVRPGRPGTAALFARQGELLFQLLLAPVRVEEGRFCLLSPLLEPRDRLLKWGLVGDLLQQVRVPGATA